MSADKYAQFIAEQQKKLSVSGTNPVNLIEKKELSDKQKDIAKLAGDKDEIDADDLKKLRSKKKDDDDDKDDDKDDDDKDDDKPAFLKKKVDESKDATKDVSKMLAAKGKTLVRNKKTGLAVLRNAKPKTVKEEEQLDEISSKLARSYLKGAEASKKQASADHYKYGWSKMKNKREGTGLSAANAKKSDKALDVITKRENGISLARGKLTGDKNTQYIKATGKQRKDPGYVEKPTKVLTKEEAMYISEEESAYLEEMVGKGKLQDILQHHKDNMRFHEKMMDHHRMMADKSEEVGDHRGFEHHVESGMEHEYQRNHHEARFDHAAGLKARANAQREMKSAKAALDAASKKIASAKYDKKDWA